MVHALGYYLPVPRESEQSRIELAGKRISSEPGHPATVTLLHADFPGWQFTLSFAHETSTPIGFEVMPQAPLLSQEELQEAWLGPNRHKRQAAYVGTPRPLTARMLRRVPVGELQEVARASLASSATIHSRSEWGRAFLETPRPGRRGRSDRDYAEVAALYVMRGHDVPALAKELGYSPSQVRNMLYTARRRKLLTAAPRGRAGGSLTDKAKELLDGER